MVLGLFFTRGVSLQTWVDSGLIDREKAIYEKHLQDGFFEKIYWFTYGTDDKRYYQNLISAGRLDSRIRVISPPHKIPQVILNRFYWWMLPFIYRKECKELDIAKSNQYYGAISAWLVSKIYKIPFYFRTGYTESLFAWHKRVKKTRYNKVKREERFLYDKCDIAAVSSVHDMNYVCTEYGIQKSKICLVRNFIDTNMFYSKVKIQDRCEKIVFIGRLDQQKNLYSMFKAVEKANIALDIYGKGVMKEELEKFAEKLSVDIRFKGVIANSEVPVVLNKYKYYILASVYEGMPKTLLEAMACGCICIGTPVEGISEVIEDGINGFLAKGTEAEDIIDAICRACSCEDKEKISSHANKLIQSTYSLDKIAEIDKENMIKAVNAEEHGE